MQYEYAVTDSRFVTPSTLVITLYASNPRRAISYRPGQYIAMYFENRKSITPARCFSLMSSPVDPGWLQIAMRVKGDFTATAAKRIMVGDKVKIVGPFGSFVANPWRDRNLVMLAGGIGITPFMSMLRTMMAGRVSGSALLVYGCPDQDDVPFADELMAMTRSNPFIHAVFAVSKGPVDRFSGQRVFQGRVTPDLLDNLLQGDYSDKSFFICGPPPFMKDLGDGLRRRHVPKRRIFIEAFDQQIPGAATVHGRPSQIYMLSALGLLVGTAVIFNNDESAKQTAAQVTVGATSGNNLSGTANGNSRQAEISKQLQSLQDGTLAGGGGVNPSTVPSQDATASPQGSNDPSPSTSSSGSVSNPTPSPNPQPGPASRPTPAPQPVPPPPPPSPTPVAPILKMWSDTTAINRGESVILYWGLTNGASAPVTCAASGGWSGAKATAGSQVITPYSTTTYDLICSNSVGSSSQTVTITVVQPPPPPPPPAPPPPPSSGGS